MGLDMYLEKRTDVRHWNFKKEEEQFEIVIKKGGVTYPTTTFSESEYNY